MHLITARFMQIDRGHSSSLCWPHFAVSMTGINMVWVSRDTAHACYVPEVVREKQQWYKQRLTPFPAPSLIVVSGSFSVRSAVCGRIVGMALAVKPHT
jgi:hypothetical protein